MANRSCSGCRHYRPGIPETPTHPADPPDCNHPTASASSSLPTFPFPNGCKHFAPRIPAPMVLLATVTHEGATVGAFLRGMGIPFWTSVIEAERLTCIPREEWGDMNRPVYRLTEIPLHDQNATDAMLAHRDRLIGPDGSPPCL